MASNQKQLKKIQNCSAFREQYRLTQIGRFYNGWLHFWFITLGCLLVIGFCIARLEAVFWWEWLTLPVTFVYMNFAEYFGHRGPMHHKRHGLGLVFHRHTQQHHVFFIEEKMGFDQVGDFKAVLFPPVLISFFLFAFAVPFWFLLSLVFTENVAWLSLAMILGYYLQYEWFHFAYHLPADHFFHRLPVFAGLQQHHRIHHDTVLMQKYNFNITWPLADWVMGTSWSKHKDKKHG